MEPWSNVAGAAAPLLRDDVDTDALFPAARVIEFDIDYGAALFANWRYRDGNSVEEPGFVLNRGPWRKACILLVGRNFGGGSSREHAVWALAGFGIRVVLGISFADIFRGNCVRNGLLAATITPAELAMLAEAATQRPETGFRVDLAGQRVEAPGLAPVFFRIDAAERERLMAGADDISLSLRHERDIARFEERQRETAPWVCDAGTREP